MILNKYRLPPYPKQKISKCVIVAKYKIKYHEAHNSYIELELNTTPHGQQALDRNLKYKNVWTKLLPSKTIKQIIDVQNVQSNH